MRSRYFLGFAAALGIAGTAGAQAPTGRGATPTWQSPGRVNYPVGQVPNRVVIPNPLVGAAAPPAAAPVAAAPVAAAPQAAAQPEAPAVPPAAHEDVWAAPGTVRPQPAPLPPPVVVQVRHQEAKPPAALPEVAPAPVTAKPTPTQTPAPAKPVSVAPPVASGPAPLSFAPTYSSAALPGTSVPCPAPAAACPPIPCEPECPCGPVGTGWVRAEWLYWAVRGQNLPPLASTSPLGTARDVAGRLSTPSTVVLYGGDKVNDDFRNGFRLTGGFWLDECGKWGIDGDFFFLGRSRDGNAAGSDANGAPIITRPFFNSVTGQADAELVSYPGILRGTTTVDARSGPVYGGGVNLSRNLCCDPCGRLNVIAGYRYLGFTDEVTITEDLTALAGQSRVPAGSRYQITDRFRTENHFHGGVIGLSGEYKYSFLYFSGRASVALGSVTQITEISGSTTITPPGGTPTTFAGGLLAQPSNIGRYEEHRFAVMPEVSLRSGVYVTDNCRVFVGYNFLYLSSVARAGDQIDTRVNTNQLPPQTVFGGPRVPAYLGATTGFWAQGVSIGAQLDF